MPVITIRGIDIEFPFKPYDVQLDYMTKVIEALQTGQNAVLESPTGTGKTLCLLCSTLAWRKTEISRLQAQAKQLETEVLPEGLSAWREEKPNDATTHFSVPKIIYASRTHSQLTQVVNELKRTAYAKNLVVSVLGSREQMCIHPDVSQQTSNQTMVHMCRNKVSKHLCHFYNNIDDAKKNKVFSSEVLDIEDLVSLGKRRMACPYYSAREISKQAECGIIFTPYNYLLDRKSRRSHNLEINGNIIIFDEAHNLEKQCEESASFDLTSLDLANCIEEVGDLLNAVTKMRDTGTIADGHEAGESSTLSEFKKEELALMKSFFLTIEKQLDEMKLPENKSKSEPGKFIFDYFSKVNLTFDTHDVLLELIEKVALYLSTLSNSFRTRGAALQKFSEVLKIVFTASDSGKNPYFGADPRMCLRRIEELSKFYRVHISEDDKSKKDVWKKQKSVISKPSRTLSYWCFSPGYAMRDLMASGVRNLILTSGTLTPISSFASELQVDFPITLENDHVIDRHQMFVASLTSGLRGGVLESTFKSRSDEKKVLELGHTLVEILKLSPGGTLVFFPSYSAMSHYVSSWKDKCAVMELLEKVKPCTVEPRAKNELKIAIEKFYGDVKCPTGGALFAVCRGKVSEGLDFANDNGRAVIIIGIPFPPWKDPKVKLKMSFLDDLKRTGAQYTINGNEWYRQQACRAVNQAIGRVIRHRYDYGSIILCDHRYTRPDQIEELPKWIQSHVTKFDDCPKFLRRLKSFFCSIKEKERVRLGAAPPRIGSGGTRRAQVGDNIPSSSSGKIAFSVKRSKEEFVKSLKPANEVDIHIESKGSNLLSKETIAMVEASGLDLITFFTGGNKRKRSPLKPSDKDFFASTSSNSKIKLGLLDALDEHCDVTKDDCSGFFGKPEEDETNRPQSSTHQLVMNKRKEEEKRSKRKKIKLKPNSHASDDEKNMKPTGDHILPREESQAREASLKELRWGPAKTYLETIRKALTPNNYVKFKEATKSYKENGDIEAVVTKLGSFMAKDLLTRDLLRAFERFIKIEQQQKYAELVATTLDKES
ncbi:regulator of telomere elongation helicase 1-like [Clavelina lepadiformis]|uniref:regulator of telomere elongation helicase 1-like n=1 Tax=Clavelina lepadiformis TaxID=159417 RepID=UPI004041D8A9